MTKRCSRCGEDKPTEEFNRNSGAKDGLGSRCRKCNSEYNKEWQLKNPDRARASWRAAERRSREKNRTPHKRLAKQYGLSLEEFDSLRSRTSCDICGNPFKEGGRVNIDHCHDTGRVRGVLCTNCNTGIGNLRDSVELLQRAIQYLTEHGSLV